MNTKRLRVFIGPVEVAGYYQCLCSALRREGVDSHFITFSDHAFGYRQESEDSLFLRFIRRVSPPSSGEGVLQRFATILRSGLWESLKTIYFLGCLFRYDVFLFAYGKSFLIYNLDLPILRLLGKRVIVNVAHGSEMRPPYISGIRHFVPGSDRRRVKKMVRLASRMRRKMAFLERFSDVIIGAPFSSTQFATRPMVNFFALGIPFFVGPRQTASEKNVANVKDGVVRLLHAPSDTVAKGSVQIRAAVKELRDEGIAIELTELAGCSNEEVLAHIQQCDLVVDQLYSDTAMASFATEAAWYGKPAIVCGYQLEYLREFIPDGAYPPSFTGRPEELKRLLRQLVLDETLRTSIGQSAREFVTTQWSPEQVAKRFKDLVHDDIAPEWWLIPSDVSYLHGCGISEEHMRANVRDIVALYGAAALQLGGKPDLERKFLEVARESVAE